MVQSAGEDNVTRNGTFKGLSPAATTQSAGMTDQERSKGRQNLVFPDPIAFR